MAAEAYGKACPSKMKTHFLMQCERNGSMKRNNIANNAHCNANVAKAGRSNMDKIDAKPSSLVGLWMVFLQLANLAPWHTAKHICTPCKFLCLPNKWLGQLALALAYRWPSLAIFQAFQLALGLNLNPAKSGWMHFSHPFTFLLHLMQPNGPHGPRYW